MAFTIPLYFLSSLAHAEERRKHAAVCSCFKNQEVLEASETAQTRSYKEQGLEHWPGVYFHMLKKEKLDTVCWEK